MTPRIRWRDYLEGKQRPKTRDAREMRFELRKRAQRAMEDLTFILTKLKMISPAPGLSKEYALIFKDENRYLRMVRACREAYDESLKSTIKLFQPEDLDLVQTACVFAGIQIHSRRQLADRHFRQRILVELNKKPYHNEGYSCYEWLVRRRQIRSDERHEKILEQKVEKKSP